VVAHGTTASFETMATRDVRDLLLAPALEPGEVSALLAPYGFRDPAEADRELQRLAADPTLRPRLAELLPELLRCLSLSVDPDQALSHLERFMRASLSPSQLLSELSERPHAMELLARAFGASPFMAQILVRSPPWFYWLADPQILERSRGRAAIEAELDRFLAPLTSMERRLDGLRIVRRREILHIGVRDLLRMSTVEGTLASLTVLAEVLIQKAYELAEETLRREYSLPALTPDARTAGSGFTVLALGKLGAGELNFSSDVDLVYLYASDRGRMARRASAPTRDDYYGAVARRMTSFLGETTTEGSVYRVDLRLRPEGRMGAVAQSLRAFEEYYRTRGRTWERLALLRARPVAGDRPLGVRFLGRVRPFLYGRPFDDTAVAEVRGLKEETDREVALRGETERNVKLGTGGIREVEFLVQAFQLRFGRHRPGLRVRDTLGALDALHHARLLDAEEHGALRRAYVFLRDVENKLQMVADAQVHALPASDEEVRLCALRLGYRDEKGLGAGEALRRDHRSHTEGVHRIFTSVFSGDRLEEAERSLGRRRRT
jgi:glutamate-ammonia-ligase adenylyltransferase